jgi:hypothetical protein
MKENGLPIIIRLGGSKDYRDPKFLTREAFWDIYIPVCDEIIVTFLAALCSLYPSRWRNEKWAG